MRFRPLRHFPVARLVAVLAAVVGLAACAGSPPPQPYPELTYNYLPPIRLNVSDVQVDSKYTPPMAPPHVEHRSPVPPYVAVQRWGEQRLKATGGTPNTARLVILDASIVEQPLQTTGGITGYFVREQAARYDGRISVELDIVAPDGQRLAYASARAERTHTVPEGATLDQREKVLFQMTETMMRQLNDALEDSIRKYLSDWVVGAAPESGPQGHPSPGAPSAGQPGLWPGDRGATQPAPNAQPLPGVQQEPLSQPGGAPESAPPPGGQPGLWPEGQGGGQSAPNMLSQPGDRRGGQGVTQPSTPPAGEQDLWPEGTPPELRRDVPPGSAPGQY